MNKQVIFSAAAAVALALSSTAGAAGSGTLDPAMLKGGKGMSDAEIAVLKSRAKEGPMAKLNPQLSALISAPATLGANMSRKSGGSAPALESPTLMTFGGYVVIDVITHGDAGALLTELESRGLRKGATAGHMVSGLFPIAGLGDLAAMNSVVKVQPAVARTRAGLVTSRGDVSMRTDEARADLGIDGTGVRVGVLSDGYDCLGGAALDQATGDLPDDIIVLEDLAPGTCTDEGRAMMQIVHDIAPGSSQAFHTAFTGTAGFAQGIRDLNEIAGAQVIVDDVIYFAEPMFQDGPIAQSADAVRANGASYFSSAGNNERNSFEGKFEGSGIGGVFGCEMHDFDPGPGVDTLQSFLLEPGTTIWSFQWDQPNASISGAPGSASDMDIVLYFPDGSWTGLGGIDLNIGGDAVEVFGVALGGTEPLEVAIGLENCGGPDPSLMKYVYFGSDRRFGLGPMEYDTASPTSYGHANAQGAIATGASAWFNTAAWNDNPSCDPACLNGFSSAGGVPILFDLEGNRVAALRLKPEIVGPDGANNTFFGFDLSFPVPGTDEPDGFPNFFGTSASAPHLAGVAALMSQPTVNGKQYYICQETKRKVKTRRVGAKAAEKKVASGKWSYGVCAADIRKALIDTAIDMDDPFTPEFDSGFDQATGYGFVDAREAIGKVYPKEKTN